MLAAIAISGLSLGAIYAMIGMAYNIMFSTSKVMSFTAGQFGMVGAIFGAWLIGVLGWPLWLGFPAAMLVGALTGYLTERIAVRPVLKSIDQHVYVLSTLALALMIQQLAAIYWGTEPRPFPNLFRLGQGLSDERFWLPIVTCAVVLVSLEVFYHRTLWGKAFVAVSEDATAARVLGLPDNTIRVVSYCLAGAVGALAGFAGGQLLHAFFAVGSMLTFYGFLPLALGGLGSHRGAIVGGAAFGILQQAASYLVGGVFVGVVTFVVFIAVLLVLPNGLFGKTSARRV